MGIRRIDAVEHTYIVTYDISDPGRWRQVFRAMKGYGQRLQLSVWQCRLDERRRVEMVAALELLVARDEDHVLIMDLGPAAGVALKVESIGKGFDPIERRATIV